MREPAVKASMLCSICERKEAFFLRPYSGERLCRGCFAKSIEDRARATIAKYDMLKFDDRVAVAVSGGKDSVSLLHVLAKLEKRYPRASLVGITVDEGIRGYRKEALEIAASNCRRLGIEHEVVSFRGLFGQSLDGIVRGLRQSGGESLTACACCGVLRRKALNIAARKVGATKIATGHTLDDDTQTILLNIFHGDVFRLAHEKPVTDKLHSMFVQRIKPFCEVPERETALYALVKKVEFQSRPCPYASEALRNDVRDMLDKIDEKHAGVKYTIFRSVERMRPALDKLDQREGPTECGECGEPTTEKICRACQILGRIQKSD